MAKKSKLPLALLTVRQVAEILQWNSITILRKAEKRELPGFKIGREWRFRSEDLASWIESKRSAH